MTVAILMALILWIIVALALTYHPCKVKRFSEITPHLPEIDRPRGVRDPTIADTQLRESDSAS